jgi:PII-like signaling protein
VFRSIGGFGHHQHRHEQAFIELQGTLPVEVVFALGQDDAERLLQRIALEKLSLFHVRMPIEYGFTGT